MRCESASALRGDLRLSGRVSNYARRMGQPTQSNKLYRKVEPISGSGLTRTCPTWRGYPLTLTLPYPDHTLTQLTLAILVTGSSSTVEWQAHTGAGSRG